MEAPEFDAVLFDFDGVLVDSEPVHFACWREILTGFGIALDWDTYNRIGRGFAEQDMVRAFCELGNPQVPFEVLWSKYPKKKVMFVEQALRQPLISEEVRELFRSLSDMRVGVVTSSDRAEVEPILKAGGLLDRLGAFVTARDVAIHKPAPDPYLKAARLLGALHPLVVEDTDVGEASGRAAGFEVLRVPEPAQMPGLVRQRLGH